MSTEELEKLLAGPNPYVKQMVRDEILIRCLKRLNILEERIGGDGP